MARPLPFFVEIRRVGTYDGMHNSAQVPFRRFDKKMNVVGHKDIRMEDESMFLLRMFYVFSELIVISRVEEDFFSLISPGGNVVKSPSVLDAQWPRHASLLGHRINRQTDSVNQNVVVQIMAEYG
jgi:hypothetical protein